MSACVGVIFVDGSSSVITIGDGNKLTPFLTGKTFSGAGSFAVGEGQIVMNRENSLQVIDNDVVDQGIILNL